MCIEIHQNAEKNINEKAEALINSIQEIDKPFMSSQQNNELFSVATITTDDLSKNAKGTIKSRFDGEIGKTFFVDKRQYGLIDEGYKSFADVVKIVHKIKAVNIYLSYDYINENLFKWLQKRYTNEIDGDYTTYLLEHSKESIKKRTIMIPVPYTIIKYPFKLGHIEFWTLNEETIDSWFMNANTKQNKEFVEKSKKQVKLDFQGYAVGVYQCVAEEIRASELAYEHLINSLSILRMVSTANLHPLINCCAYEYGQKVIRTKHWFGFSEGKTSPLQASRLIEKDIPWNVGDLEMSMLGQLSDYDRLLTLEKLTPYQQKLFDATLIYSKNTLRYEVFDKILYILVALESMLLKGESESIQQNIAERIAFITGKTSKERVEIVKEVKDVYAIRSKYIHHGISDFEDNELLSKFMLRTLAVFQFFASKMDEFDDKVDLLEYLDGLKYS